MKPSFLHTYNQKYIDEQYALYLSNPEILDPEWLSFFEGFNLAQGQTDQIDKTEPFDAGSIVVHVIDAYQRYGHLSSNINPMHEPKKSDYLDHKVLGIESRLGELVDTYGLLPESKAPLSKVIARLESIYLGSIGVEIYKQPNLDLYNAVHQLMVKDYPSQTSEIKKKSLEILMQAKTLEDFLHKKFQGAKRFSLEGAETFSVVLTKIFDVAANLGVDHTFLAMAHRGRINTMCNLLDKPYQTLFENFDAAKIPLASEGLGDVKYHMGINSKIPTLSNKEMSVTLAANPSHLESVDPVILGRCRAFQDQHSNPKSNLAVIVHGDASVAGQGIIYETMQMMHLAGYQTEGTIHIVINNQIGYTALPNESRSTRYCTDIAKTFGAPVFHVNSEDIQACLKVATMAVTLRSQFGVDVYIDLICHRLYGHNEADEPRFTQPLYYKKILEKPNLYEQYQQKLLKGGVIDQQYTNSIKESYLKILNEALEKAKKSIANQSAEFTTESVVDSYFSQVQTQVAMGKIKDLLLKICTVPTEFHLHKKIEKLIQERKGFLQTDGDDTIDWSLAETLAYATLLDEGFDIRLSGQDAGRGTFSHRHSIFYDQINENTFIPLNQINEHAQISIYNSLLSEYACLGFEYGYAIDAKKSLVIWEAQFGDFANGAQIIIDNYLTSSFQKWREKSAVTLFLPHGFEGLGAEHSSCRLERYLQLAGQNNITVLYPTTPSQWFHAIRAQMHTDEKKPLIVLTPKGLLRYRPSFSPLQNLTDQSFQDLLEWGPKSCRRLIFCTGRIFYDLLRTIQSDNIQEISIIRVESLYPIPKDKMSDCIGRYSPSEIYFVQEEPSNQGAFDHLYPTLKEISGQIPIGYAGRKRLSAPVTGFGSLFHHEQKQIIKKATTLGSAYEN